MKNLERIKKTINGHKSFLKERFEVKSIGIFGSCLRGEQSEKSDIDILIDFYSTIDLFEFIRVGEFLR